MKRLSALIIGFFLACISTVSATIHTNDIRFNLNSWNWQIRESYAGIFSSSVGYGHLQKTDGILHVYCSNRNIEANDIDVFYNDLYPFDTNLAPYTTPNWEKTGNLNVSVVENATVAGLPAKKLTMEASYPHKGTETVITYLFTREKVGNLWNSYVGYTISFSCPKDKYKDYQKEIDKIIQEVAIE